MKKIFTLLLATLGLNTACSQNFENMEVKEFAELIADSIACHTQTFRSENVVILDVRKADEFAEGHIKARSYRPVPKRLRGAGQNKALPKRQDYRPSIAVAVAAQLMLLVYWLTSAISVNLKGGILAWKKANMPVIEEYRLWDLYFIGISFVAKDLVFVHGLYDFHSEW